MARWIRLVKAHPTMASSWSTSIVLKYCTGETSAPVDPRVLPGDLRARKPGGYPTHHTQYLAHSPLSVCTGSGERVDFAMGVVVQLVMELVEIGNREDAHGKGSSGGKPIGDWCLWQLGWSFPIFSMCVSAVLSLADVMV